MAALTASFVAACGSDQQPVQAKENSPQGSVMVKDSTPDRWAAWASDKPVNLSGKPYEGINLIDLRAPTDKGSDPGTRHQFDAVGQFGQCVAGLITNTAGRQDAGRFGITLVPRYGNGITHYQWNVDVDGANAFIAQYVGAC